MASAAPTSAPPLPAVQRYFEVSLYLLVSTSLLAVVTTGKLDLFSTLFPPAALLYRGVRLWRGHGPEFSTRVATGLVLGYFLFFPLDLWGISLRLAAGAPNPLMYAALLAAVHLLLFAMLVRLFSARTRRDHAFLAVLAVAGMLASAILTVETGFLIALAVFLVLGVSTFVALEIQRGAVGAVVPSPEPGSIMARQLNRALGVTSILVAFGVLALGLVLFFVIPRFTTGYLSAFNLRPTLMTGFSDDVTLGEIGRIKKSSAVVMRIHVEGDPARALDIHWRGIGLTNFDGDRWFTPAQPQTVVSPDDAGNFRFATGYPGGSEFNSLSYTVLMEPLATDAIFVAPRPALLRGGFSEGILRAGGVSRQGYLLADSTGSLFNPMRNIRTMRYQGVSLLPTIPPARLRQAPASYPAEIRKTYLQLPSLDPRIPRLAEEITARSSNEYDRAASIELYLKTHYAYTLDLTGPPQRDPLAYFLFVRRAGHCEYFASAMAVMLRAVGIPSRYVTGFLPGEYNDVGGDYIVRASDAHSWVEVYFPDYGWLTFDPTPPGNERPSGLLSRLGLYWDWLHYTWSEGMVNYDFSHQVALGRTLKTSSRVGGERLRAFYRARRDAAIREILALDTRMEKSRYFLPGVLALLVLLLIVLRGRPMLRYAWTRLRLRAHRAGNLTAGLATLEYTEMLRLLEKHGWRKSPSQTPREFAVALPKAELTAPVLRLTELYHAARFGGRTPGGEEMASLLRAIRGILQSPGRVAR